jgi:hypothetical protein
MGKTLREIVGEAIGEASMCWSETPKGVFDSTRASDIVERIMTEVGEKLDFERTEAHGKGILEAVKVAREGSHKICVMIDSDECVYGCGRS